MEFDEEFSASFDFEVIGKMISVYLNDTSITDINALYHHLRLEMMAEQEREDHIRDNMDWGFSKEHSIALVDNRKSKEYWRANAVAQQTKETIIKDLSKLTLLKQLSLSAL